MLPPAPHQMLVHVLAGTPDVLESLLSCLNRQSAAWDERPVPQRWTLREMTAHLADMEEVWRERVERTLSETEPFLLNVDEEQLSVDNDYAHSEPLENLARFRQCRAGLVQRLQSLPETAWQRLAEREYVGHLSLLEQMHYTLMHDCYHTHQVVQWLKF